MTITVSCPACTTSFPVDPAKIPVGGVRAQCSACPEIFSVDRPEDTAAEAASAEVEETFAGPSAAVELDEMEVPAEVMSSFGADANVVADISDETSDAFGEREISFDSITTEADAALAINQDLEVEAPDGEAEEAAEEEAAEEEGVEEAEAAPISEKAAPTEAETAEAAPIQFGKRSPEDKARSLARSLVSDLIAYNPEKHTEALASGTLVQVFSEEIEKSWKEYRDQVDPDVMTQGTFFNDALNELLADGESVFNVEG